MAAAVPEALVSLLPVALRSRLRELQLRSWRSSGATGLGGHASRQRGSGLEFAQHRAYAPGDAPRQIDWQLYARTDRLFVREAERDSALRVWVLLDHSASMGLPATTTAASATRLNAACSLVAAVVELAWRQGDALGLALLGQDALQLLPMAGGNRMRERCNQALAGLRAGGGWPSATAQLPLLAALRGAELVLLLSDGLDPELPALARRLASGGREVRVLQLLTVAERDFDFVGGHCFVDPETGAQQLTDARAARAEYLQQFAAAQTRLAQQLRADSVALHTAVLDQPLLPMLAWLVDPRARAVRP